MRTNKQKQISYSLLGVLLALLFVFSSVSVLPFQAQATTSTTDSSVGNYSSMSTDVIYQIVTDRFVDGDSTNNATGDFLQISP